MSLDIPIKVGYQSIKDAAAEAQNLKRKLVDVSSMNVDVHARMDAVHGGSQAVFMQQNRAIQNSIDKLVRGGQSGSWSTGPDGSRTYVSPSGVRYGSGGAPPPPQQAPSAPGGSTGNPAWTAMKYGAALLGGFSIMNFLHESMSIAASTGSQESDIRARGGRNIRGKLSRYGYMPDEAMSMQETIMRRTGFQGDTLDGVTDTAARYGRLTGLGGERIAQHIAGNFALTGAGKEATEKQLKLLRDTAVALGARGRIEEVLSTNQSIMQHIVSGRGGGELGAHETMQMTAMQMALWGTSGQAWKGQSGANNMASLGNGIQSGGNDPGTRMFVAQALGIKDVTDRKSLWEYQKRQQEGASFRNVKALLDEAERIGNQFGDPDAAKYIAQNAMTQLGLKNIPVEGLFEKGFRARLDEISKDPEQAMQQMQDTDLGQTRIADANKDGKANLTNTHRATVSGMANFKADIGNFPLSLVDRFKNAGVKSTHLFQKGQYPEALSAMFADNPLGQAMLVTAGIGGLSKLADPLSFGAGATTAGGAGAIAKTARKIGVGKTLTGVGAAAETMRAGELGVKGEDAMVAKFNRGEITAKDMNEFYKSTKQDSGGWSNLLDVIGELIKALHMWAKNVNEEAYRARLEREKQTH